MQEQIGMGDGKKLHNEKYEKRRKRRKERIDGGVRGGICLRKKQRMRYTQRRRI